MSDAGHRWTDKELKALERRLGKEYKQASKEMQAKAKKNLQAFKVKQERQLKRLKNGEITQEKYTEWLNGQLFTQQWYKDMISSLTKDSVRTDAKAMGMVNDDMSKVFAENVNFAEYQMEAQTGVNTNAAISFNLYNEDTVRLLATQDPTLLPKKYPDLPKDELWNRKHINSCIMQGIMQGESMDGIAGRLRTVVGMNERAAIRNARTMTTAAENAGRRHQREKAAERGIQMQEQWIATLDTVTRFSHRILHGQKTDIGEPWTVDGKEIRFPGDPWAEGYLIYNCRCTTASVLPGYEYESTTLSGDYPINETGLTYEEWKKGKNEHGEPDKPEKAAKAPEPPKGKSYRDTVEDIRKRIAARGGVIEESDLIEAGQALAKDSHAWRDEVNKKRAQLVAEIDADTAIVADRDKATREELSKLADALDKARAGDLSYMQRLGYSDKYDMLDRMDGINAEMSKLRKTLRDKKTALRESDRAARFDNAKWLKGKLGEIRGMGTSGFEDDVTNHLYRSRSPMRKEVEQAYSYYPTEWVKKSVARGHLSPKKANRGYYDDYYEEIAISGYGGQYTFSTSIHELGHRMERAVPGIMEAEKKFYERRTVGEPLVWLGGNYKKDEKSRKDNFVHPYMGKDYGGSAYELVSMGFQYAYGEPDVLAKDPDMEAWIYGLLSLE